MKIKAVLDTNVIISGLFWENDCSKILRLWNDTSFILLTNPLLIDELKKVLSDFKIAYPPRLQDVLISNLLTKAKLVLDIDTDKMFVKDDPDDDKFVQVAYSGAADYIITQDKHLLHLDLDDLKIVTPREFVAALI